MMQFVEEHQEVSKEDTMVMLVGDPRKWRRIQNLAAESRQKRKDRTRGINGSRRKSAVAHRKMTHRAGVAWCKRVIIRKNWTHKNFGLFKGFTATRMRMTHSAKLAWCRGHGEDNTGHKTQK
jgi:hypothetical protein